MITTVFTWIILAIAGYALIKLILAPMRLLFKFIINGVCGISFLLFFNILSPIIGFTLDITFLNVMIVGVLGLPGIILLSVIKLFL